MINGCHFSKRAATLSLSMNPKHKNCWFNNSKTTRRLHILYSHCISSLHVNKWAQVIPSTCTSSPCLPRFMNEQRSFSTDANTYSVPIPGGVEKAISEPKDFEYISRFMDAYKLCSTIAEKQAFLLNWYSSIEQLQYDIPVTLELKNLNPHELKIATLLSEIVEEVLKVKGGVRFILDTRTDLLKMISTSQEPILRVMDIGFRIPLSRSFDPSTLKFNRLTMSSPAILFQRIIENERVHAYRGEGWNDIRQRIGKARRLFYFEHAQMPSYPLTFLHTAYTLKVTSSIDEIFRPVDKNVEQNANTAIFYSISSIEPGLKGIELGSTLIKRAVDYIQGESPQIVNFYTLSPIPRFIPWLKKMIQTRGSALISQAEINIIKEIAKQMPNSSNIDMPKFEKMDLENVNVHLLKLVSKALNRDEEFIKHAHTILNPWKYTLMKLCSIYILKEKDARGNATDPVTNFHIRNGAQVAQLNWNGNMSKEGLEQSFGIMTNYHYELNHLQARSELYLSHGVVAYADESQTPLSLGVWKNPIQAYHLSHGMDSNSI